MSVKLKPIIFVIVLSVMCSLLLTFGATALKGPQERNARFDRQQNILRAANILPNGKVTPTIVQSVYHDRIKEFWVGADSTLRHEPGAQHWLHIMVVFGDDSPDVEQVILPFTVKGVWGPISGYLALLTDLNTVTGFTVYDQQETAGLGAQVADSWFQNQWRGKKLYDTDGYLRSVVIAKGAAHPNDPLLANTVDGISGATGTGRALAQNLATKLEVELPLLQKINWQALKK